MARTMDMRLLGSILDSSSPGVTRTHKIKFSLLPYSYERTFYDISCKLKLNIVYFDKQNYFGSPVSYVKGKRMLLFLFNYIYIAFYNIIYIKR